MIKYVEGDILLSNADAIAHGVAPNDNFRQGLALSLRELWPALYKDFRHYCQINHPSEGEAWSWKGAGGPVIINLMTQEPPSYKGGVPGRAKLTHINHSLKNMVKEIEKHEVKSLAMTKLATGVGGLDWEDVKPLLEKHLRHLDIPIFIYEKFTQSRQAKEA